LNFLWRLVQALIVFAVMGSNIAYEWTPNGYVAAMAGVGVAFVVTWVYGRVRYGRSPSPPDEGRYTTRNGRLIRRGQGK
jgi:hypothetical protein